MRIGELGVNQTLSLNFAQIFFIFIFRRIFSPPRILHVLKTNEQSEKYINTVHG